MNKFSVGEAVVVAEWAIPGDSSLGPYIGADVVVLEVITCTDYGFNYIIQATDGLRMECGEAALRKKRSPQDWRRICRLDEVRKSAPREVA